MGISTTGQWNHTCQLDTTAKPRRNIGWISSNWSGYAITGKKGAFKRVSAKWNVPFVRPSRGASYSSAWIGIDGFSNSHLIQTGTGHDWIDGKAYYYAWWEILPASVTFIPLPIQPGDRMHASMYSHPRRDARCIAQAGLGAALSASQSPRSGRRSA